MNETVTITLHNQHLSLLPQRAVLWQEQRMLIIADPHFGKAETFRRSGIVIPEGITADDLNRLERALTASDARTLLILGDLMHSATPSGDNLRRQLRRFRQTWKELEIVLVNGNHDRLAGPPPAEFGLQQVCDQWKLDPFLFVHHPRQASQSYVFGGHLHPAVRLSGSARQSERLPCFFVGPDHAILPAFGGFTGSSTVRPGPDDRVFVIADNRVVEMDLV